MKNHESISAKKRYALRAIEQSKNDSQIADLKPDLGLWEDARREGLSYDRVIGIFLDGYGDRPALAERMYSIQVEHEDQTKTRIYHNAFTTVSYRELHDRIKSVSMAWRTHPECRVSRDDFVLIMGFADVDFVTLDFACTYSKAVTVPVQSSTSGADLGEIVENIAPSLIATDLNDLSLAVELAVLQDSIKSVVVFNFDDHVTREQEIFDEAKSKLKEAGNKSLFTIRELIDFGSTIPFTYLPDDVDELEKTTAIIHSSGSTGKPKGAVIRQNAFIHRWVNREITLPRITVLLAPLNHIMGRMNLMAILSCGGTGYFTLKPDMSTLLEDIRLARPTFLSLFPRIFELIYQHFQNEVARRHEKGITQINEIEQDVKREMRHTFLGDRLLCIVYGSAPTSEKVRNFIEECFDVLMVEGYGNTESGTGGLTLDGKILVDQITSYKLRDVPELGYFTTDKPFPRGEFLFKSKYGIKEYYKQPEATAALYDEEGYLCTGDIVELIEKDEIRVVDRRKDVIKLSHGEYVAAGALGTIFEAASSVIKQIYVYGNSEQSYLLAVVVPEKEVLLEILGDDYDEIQIKNLIRSELNNVAQNEQLKKFEVPRDFVIEFTEFTQANGLLSSVRKRLRPALKKKYEASLEALYEHHQSAQDDRMREIKKDHTQFSTIEKLIILLENQLRIKGIQADPPRSFNALGGDSIGAVLFSQSIEEILEVSLPADLILSPTGNINSWAAYIDQVLDSSNDNQVTFDLIHGKGAQHLRAEDLELTRFIDGALLKESQNVPLSPPIPKTVLLTGANGFLGHIICLEWLKNLSKSGGKLICLIREVSDQRAYEKLSREFRGFDKTLESEFDRLSKNHFRET